MGEKRHRMACFLSTAVIVCLFFIQGCLSSNSVSPGSGESSTVKQAAPAVPPSGTTDRKGEEEKHGATGNEGVKPEQGPRKAPLGAESLSRQARSRPHLPPPVPKMTSDPSVEKIDGYRTPGECLVLRSRHFPDAVVAVTLPEDYYRRPEKTYPLVVAFGGAGECAKPPRSGALAWMHYYQTDEAVQALSRNRLVAEDFRGLVNPAQLNQYNTELAQYRYRGIILACPYSPLLSPLQGLEFPNYEKYVMEELIPELERRYRIRSGDIGVDGVSMGGSRSMYYGFKYPEVFKSVGSIQGAFGPYFDIYADLVKKNRSTLKERSIQLVTSDGDVMAPSVARLHRLLEDNGIPHKYLVLTGPHDYIFNQGPGSIALLVFHNSALRDRTAKPIQ